MWRIHSDSPIAKEGGVVGTSLKGEGGPGGPVLRWRSLLEWTLSSVVSSRGHSAQVFASCPSAQIDRSLSWVTLASPGNMQALHTTVGLEWTFLGGGHHRNRGTLG